MSDAIHGKHGVMTDLSTTVCNRVARCLNCDYLLRDLADARCPECGRSFDPSDRYTFNATGRPFPAWARLLVRPIGWPMQVVTLTPIAVSLLHLCRPGGDFSAAINGLFIWFIVGIAWCVRLFARMTIWIVYERPSSTLHGHWSRWTVAPALFVGWIFLTGAEWPQRLAFRVSQPALDRLARRAISDPSLATVTLPQRVGFLRVSTIEHIPEGVRLYTGPGYDGVPCGYAYCPAGRPPDGSFNRYYPWADEWWQYWANDQRLAGAAAVLPTPPPAPTSAQSTR